MGAAEEEPLEPQTKVVVRSPNLEPQGDGGLMTAGSGRDGPEGCGLWAWVGLGGLAGLTGPARGWGGQVD